ncbi:hypothetical protein K0504_01080 [Neiella marina]|uniref:Uncharacterized protein n=1 Tax=Neiella holothuriorum TaxID=2870530 RepID=A0ABS7EBA0_9GAMM|nr:hypothetical protein [Neiella holothuriorum]MBW8189613.1 hypothetical protein [Neiella holothuriorum]
MNISPPLVYSWLQTANDFSKPQERVDAIERIVECFGSFELAERYVEIHISEARL